jgi:hypothetical protein
MYVKPDVRRGFWELWREQQQSHDDVTTVTVSVLGRVVEVARWVDGQRLEIVEAVAA